MNKYQHKSALLTKDIVTNLKLQIVWNIINIRHRIFGLNYYLKIKLNFHCSDGDHILWGHKSTKLRRFSINNFSLFL